jgi:sirohydrochlorin ferrochelatase
MAARVSESGYAFGTPGSDRSRAVLLVAHGSRDPRAAGIVAALADAVRPVLAAGRTGQRVAVAHLDFTEPSVGTALRGLAAEGATEVVVVPLLFAPGYHLRVDLPAAVAEVRVGRPDLAVSIAEPLGAEPDPGEPDLLLDALAARVHDRGFG